MRIISGIHKGRRIQAPKKLPVRPTTDMSKESLFNILNNNYTLSECSVLDLYAGIGSISLEFGSRGCTQITAIDQHPGCIRFIEQTAEELELPIYCIKSDAIEYLKNSSTAIDIIFADPPYDSALEHFKTIHEQVFINKLLNPNGSLIIEHSKHTSLEELPSFEQSRNYGSSVFSFFALSGK